MRVPPSWGALAYCWAMTRVALPTCLPARPPAVQLTGEGTVGQEEWCAGHPNAASHAAVAEQLAAFIREVVPEYAEA